MPAVTLEVAKRPDILLPESIILVVIAGPVKLATQLTGLGAEEMLQYQDFLGLAAKATLTFLRAMGETGIDRVAVREDFMGPMGSRFSIVPNRCDSPLWNIAKFYGMQALLMLERFASENATLYKKFVNKGRTIKGMKKIGEFNHDK